jgi:hypothetical protein
MKRIDGTLLMRHKHLAGALVELRKIAKTASGADGVLPHPPEAFDGMEVVATMGGQQMEAKLVMRVVEGRVELVRPVHPAPIDDHPHLLLRCLEGRHHVVDILAPLLRITVRDDFREDCGSPVLDGAHHTESHATRDPAPGARAHPRLAFATLLAFALAVAEGTREQTSALHGAPPARPGQSTAPQDRFVFLEHNHLATTCLVLEGGKCERAVREISRGGIPSAGGAIGAYVVFFHTPRTRARPRWTPVCWANTVASARQLH